MRALDLSLACLLRAAVASAMLSLFVTTAFSSDDWPQYRGEEGSGGATTAGLLDRSDVSLKVNWRAKVGSGYSGVVVAGGRVVTMFSDGESDVVAAFSEQSGEELWRHELGETYAGHDGSHSGPLSTPLIAGEVVIALGPRGNLVALEVATGDVRWSSALVADQGAVMPFYGFAASPILVPGAVVVEVGSPDAAVAAFDLRTGEKKWTAGSDSIEYQTPVLLEHGGRRVLVAAGMTKLFGIDPASGTVQWEYAHEGSGGGYGASKLMPVAAGEGRLFLNHKGDSSRMVRITERDGVATVEKIWENASIRHSYSDPVYHDGHIYAFSSRFLTCVDAETGEARWKSRPPGDGFLMLVDDRLVIVTKQGSVHVAKASPDGYDEIASLEVFPDELAWSAPSFANGHIFVRSLGEVARVSVGKGRSVMAVGKVPGSDVSGTAFGRFLARLEKSDEPQKMVDDYLAKAKSIPVVEGDRVHFLYSGPGEDLAIEGEMFGVAAEDRMIPVRGTNLFYYSMSAAPDARANYVLVRDYEEILDPRNPRKATTSVLRPDMELSFSGAWEMSWFAMSDWAEPAYLQEAPESRRGKVITHEVESATLESKLELKIYLPAGYEDSDRRYPVIYLHGGTGALEEGQWANALDNLIGKSVEPVIVAFLPGDSIPGPQYVGVFLGELLPSVDGSFQTIAEADSRASVGQGFGGFFAFMAALAQPGIIGKVASQGAFFLEFAWGPVYGMLKNAEEQPLDIYLDWGFYDLTSPVENWSMRQANQKALEELKARGYDPAGGEANDGSGWPSWRNRTAELLQAMFPAGG